MDSQLSLSANALKSEIRDAVMKFITDTGQTPGISVEIHEAGTQAGPIISVKVDIIVTM